VDEVGSGSTQRLTKHVPTGFGLKMVSPYTEFNSETYIYRGEDCVEHFVNCLDDIYDQCYEKLSTVKDMEFTDEDKEKFYSATECGICLKPFNEDCNSVSRVPDHDHISGCFRSAAHAYCNLQMRQQKHIVIFMHNAKG
jgi:hypothetical protein